jgi:hypothetical protein
LQKEVVEELIKTLLPRANSIPRDDPDGRNWSCKGTNLKP